VSRVHEHGVAVEPEHPQGADLDPEGAPAAEREAGSAAVRPGRLPELPTYLGTGGGFKGAPDLGAEGRKHRGVSWQIRHLNCPQCVDPGSPMPEFRPLGAKRIRALAIFLEASKGGK